MTSELDKAAEEYAKTQPEWCMTHVAYEAGFMKAIELSNKLSLSLNHSVDFYTDKPLKLTDAALSVHLLAGCSKTIDVLQQFAGVEK